MPKHDKKEQPARLPSRIDADHHRLYWRSRRGMLEIEIKLLPFVEAVYPTLNAVEQAAYQQLLEFEDWQIFDWLQEREFAEDPAISAIVSRINAYHMASPQRRLQ